METFEVVVLGSLRQRFRQVKETGERAIAQLSIDDLRWSPDEVSNSIAVIIQHLHGNMLSRWTDFLTSDGEKPWRERDREFESDGNLAAEELMQRWEAGWACLFAALDGLKPADLTREVVIRGQPLTVIDALHRQLAHCSDHVGQIVWIAKARKGKEWQTLSIARGQSRGYRPTQKD